jgi:DNA-binding response OmpR family regulator
VLNYPVTHDRQFVEDRLVALGIASVAALQKPLSPPVVEGRIRAIDSHRR